MKNISKFLLLFFLMGSTIFSCKKEETKDYYVGGTPPMLKSDISAYIPISYSGASNAAITLSWSNPNYLFSTGVSSQNVKYIVEIDTSGSNFTNPNLKSIGVTSDLSHTILQSELNNILLNQLVLAVGVPHNLEMRVKATLINGTAQLISNVLKFVSTPYAIPPKVTPPGTLDSSFRDGKLYITGSATPGNWMSGGDAELLSQKFTKLSSTLYEITIALTGGNSYTFVPIYGDWGNKYSIGTKNDPNEVNGGDFQKSGEDILAPAASGNYKIQVDFQRGKFVVTKQ